MKTNRLHHKSAGLLLAIGLAVSAGLPSAALAQKPDTTGIKRSDVLRHDLDKKDEAIQVRVDFAPGSSFPGHSHPGVELAFVLEGTMEYILNGKPVILKAGQSLFIPAGAVHSARNVGSDNAAELATYLVEKGKPILVLEK